MKNFDIIEGYFFGTIIFCFTIFLFTMFLVFMAALGMELSGINCHKSASMKKLEYNYSFATFLMLFKISSYFFTSNPMEMSKFTFDVRIISLNFLISSILLIC